MSNTIIKLIAIIILVFLIAQIISCHANAEDEYPLYVGKSAEDKLLQDPVYRHKQFIEQLIRIECAIMGVDGHAARGVQGSRDNHFQQTMTANYRVRYRKVCTKLLTQ